MLEATSQRVDTLALSIGAKATGGSLLLACVLLIVLGASSMLETLNKVDSHMATMSEQLDTANEGVAELNRIMESVPQSAASINNVVASVDTTQAEVERSAKSLAAMRAQTDDIGENIDAIAAATTSTGNSLSEVSSSTDALGGGVSTLNRTVPQLAASQKKLLGEVRMMNGGLSGMNGSLAYVIRILNYMTAPPGGGDFTMRVELDKKALPPIPGVRAQVDPVRAFPRGSWKTYTGP